MAPKDRNDLRENDVLPKLEDVQGFVMSLFENWTEGPTGIPGQCSVSLDTRREEFFPADNYMCSLKIGVYISEKYQLQKGLCFTWAMPDHCFRIDDEGQKKIFYQKWPKVGVPKQTVKQFSEMVYDLILIQNGRMIVPINDLENS